MVDFDDLKDRLFDDLSADLEDDDNYSENSLKAKIKFNIIEAYEDRCYPDTYTDEAILKDMNERLYSKIVGRTLFDYNQIGNEFETTHTENNITRIYNYTKKRLFPINSICRVI